MMARRIDAYFSATNPDKDKGVHDNDNGKHCRRWLWQLLGRRHEGFVDMTMTMMMVTTQSGTTMG
jgi:hypothetical protein